MNSPRNMPTMMMGKPSQTCARNTYETGGRTPATTNGQATIPNALAFETDPVGVMQAPGFILQVDAAIDSTAPDGNYWLLAWDLNPTDVVLAAVAAGQMGAARYSWGPAQVSSNSGGMIVREPEEWFDLDGQHVRAFPFDAGCVMALSLTSVLYTDAGDYLKLTVRTKAR